jgi:ABC-type glycerol-3-phosphate transport system substrate-binding protein
VLNNGGRLINEDLTKYMLNSPEVIQTVEWLVSLVNAGLAPQHDGTANGGYKDLLPLRQVVMQPAVSLRIATWRQQGDVSFATGYNPQGPKSAKKQNFTHGATHGYGIFKKDPARTTAAALATLWISRVESGIALAEAGLQTPYKQVIESAEFQGQLKRDTDLWPFYELMPNVLPFANGPASEQERAAIDTQARAIWAKRTSVREGLNEMQRVAQGLLDESLK